jgi:chromosome segregation ATPase
MCWKTWLLFGFSLPLMAQSDDSATLKAILQEIRELRQELREGTVLAARFHDLENRLQLQRERVKKAGAKYEDAAGQLRAVEGIRDRAAEDLKYATAAISSVTEEEKKKDLTAKIVYSQRTLESNPQVLAQAQTVVEGAHQDLADEQKKLDALQQEFDALGKQFEKAPAKPDR